MKKVISIFLILICCFALFGCKKNKKPNSASPTSSETDVGSEYFWD